MASAPYSTSATTIGTGSYYPGYFGDCVSDRSGDAYPGVIAATTTNGVSDATGSIFIGRTAGGYVMRAASGIGGVAAYDARPVSGSAASPSGGDPAQGPFPSRAANALFLGKIAISDGGTMVATGRRGVYPGALFCPQTGVYTALQGTGRLLAGTGDYVGKTLLMLEVSQSNPNTPPSGMGFIDLTGPWR